VGDHPYRMVIRCTVCEQDLAGASAAEQHYQAMLGSLVMVARLHREQVGENHWIIWRYLGED